MLKSTNRLFSLLIAVLMVFSVFSVNAQEKKRDKNRWDRGIFVTPPPVPAIPSIPALPAIPPIPAVPAVQFSLPSLPQLPGLSHLPELPELPSLPELPELPALPDLEGFDSFSMNGGHLQLSDSESGLFIESEGKVRFNNDYSAIESLSRDGYLLVMDKETRKQVFIEEDAKSGEIVYSYYKRGRLLSFEGEGEKWLKSVWNKLVEVYK